MSKAKQPEIPRSTANAIRKALLHWNSSQNQRSMPWRGEKDPYRIWLSEIILQQTRVSQGTAYYNRFVAAYPSITALAAAADDEVFKLWEGLGYYSRCRNLLATARAISLENGGNFPASYEDILKLKGVGEYTAAAIASFAYNQPRAVLDGNVFRVLSRLFAVDTPIDTPHGKKVFRVLADSALDAKQPGLYNQAIMDFGATICKPQPECGQCPLQKYCDAFKLQIVTELPVKLKRLTIKQRFFTQVVFVCGNRMLLQRREEKDIWRHIYQFVTIGQEKPSKWTPAELEEALRQFTGDVGYQVVFHSGYKKQQLTHQTVHTCFVAVKLARHITVEGYTWYTLQELHELPFPRVTRCFVEDELFSLMS